MASSPQYWIFPLQTVVCAGLLARSWPSYRLKWPGPIPLAVGIGAGVLVFVLWIAPQQWLGFPPRLEGFEPGFFGASGWPYAANLAMRFIRLAVVVPLVEEIFWRGFLLRFLVHDDFEKVPIGTFTWLSFGVVTVGFVLEHSGPDWPAAALTGILYNLVAYRTRSLAACVLAHAVTNALLGIYVLRTGQWGFW